MRIEIWLETLTVFRLDGGIICLSYSIYKELMMLDRLKYRQQSWYCLNQVPLSLIRLLNIKKTQITKY
jgi:hypothetical protein